MSIEARLRAVEKAADASVSARYDFTLEQVLVAARAILRGTTPEEAWASVGPPRTPLRAGEPSLAELAALARLRGGRVARAAGPVEEPPAWADLQQRLTDEQRALDRSREEQS